VVWKSGGSDEEIIGFHVTLSAGRVLKLNKTLVLPRKQATDLGQTLAPGAWALAGGARGGGKAGCK